MVIPDDPGDLLHIASHNPRTNQAPSLCTTRRRTAACKSNMPEHTSKRNLLEKCKMRHSRKSCSASGHHVSCWKRWFVSGDQPWCFFANTFPGLVICGKTLNCSKLHSTVLGSMTSWLCTASRFCATHASFRLGSPSTSLFCEDFYDDCFSKFFEQPPATALLA